MSIPVGFSGGFLWTTIGGNDKHNFEVWTATAAIEETTFPFIDANGASQKKGAAAIEATDGGVLAAGEAGDVAVGADEIDTDKVLLGAPTFHLDVFVFALLAFSVAVGGAWLIYGRGRPDEDPTLNMGGFTTILEKKYYLDDIGYRFVVVPVRDKLSAAASWSSNVLIDKGIIAAVGGATKRVAEATYHTVDQKVVDGGVNGAAFSAAWWSDKLKRTQSGNVQQYAGALVIGTVAIVLAFALVN